VEWLRACVIVVAGLLAGCGTVKRAKLLLPAGRFGLEAVAPSVFVEKEMPIDQREKWSTARMRMKRLKSSVLICWVVNTGNVNANDTAPKRVSI
jgi:hypothetical protein